MLFALMLLALPDAQQLVEDLADLSIEVRDEATAELRRRGPKAVPALVTGLDHGDAEVRARVLALLTEQLDALPPDVLARHPALRDAKLKRDAEAIIRKLARRRLHGYANRAALLQYEPEMRALRDLGPDVIHVLLRELDGPATLQVTVALGLFDDPRAAAALDNLSESPAVCIVPGGG